MVCLYGKCLGSQRTPRAIVPDIFLHLLDAGTENIGVIPTSPTYTGVMRNGTSHVFMRRHLLGSFYEMRIWGWHCSLSAPQERCKIMWCKIMLVLPKLNRTVGTVYNEWCS